MRSTRFLGSEGSRGASSRRGRLGAGAGLALAATLMLSGCQWTSPIETDRAYEPADGSSITIGGVDLRNIVIVSDGHGAPGTVAGMAVNNTDQDVQLSIPDESGQALQVTVPARGSARLGTEGDGGPITIASVPEPDGAYRLLSVVTSQGQSAVNAPVLPPEGYYASLAPTAPSTRSATASPAGTQTGPAQNGTPGPASPPPTGEATAGPTAAGGRQGGPAATATS